MSHISPSYVYKVKALLTCVLNSASQMLPLVWTG